MWTLGMKPETTQFTATGRRHPTASEELYEMSTGKLKGVACFNSITYILAALYGKPVPAAHGGSTIAYDQIWTPKIAGAQTPQPLTIQQGDANFYEQYTYGLATGFGYEVSRKAEVDFTSDFIMQSEADPVGLTASPTVIPVVPMTGTQFNLYLDPTSAALGTTQIVKPIKFGPAASGYYGEVFYVNRSNLSFSETADTAPKFDFKLLLPADTQGKSLRANLQAGSRVYARVNAAGPTLDSGLSINCGFTHDLCLFVTNVADFEDSDGIYAIEWTLALAEDSAWGSGQAHKITLTNSLSVI
jgi:hypothetical protein